jgi:hypothetical protein
MRSRGGHHATTVLGPTRASSSHWTCEILPSVPGLTQLWSATPPKRTERLLTQRGSERESACVRRDGQRSQAAASSGNVATVDDVNLVSVGVSQVGAVVPATVVRALTWRAFVDAPSSESCTMR